MIIEYKKTAENKSLINLTNRHAVGIDGIRGLVALIIALFHFELTFSFGKHTFFSTGYLGVEFFFVLSGFLLAKELLEKAAYGKNNIGSILKKKLVRLYPAYAVALFALGLVYTIKWFHGDFEAWLISEHHLKEFVIELLCLQTTGISSFQYVNGPAWYVSALIISTIILMPLLKYGKSIFSAWIAPTISFLIYTIFFFKDPYMNPNNLWAGFLSTALARAFAGMLLGVFIYNVYTKIQLEIQNFNYLTINVLESVFVVFFFGMLMFRQPSRWNYLVFLPICALILLMFSAEGVVTKILSFKPFLFLGKISFSFYIMQSICSNFIGCWFPKLSQPYVTAFYLFLNLAAAILLHYSVEIRFPKVLKRLESL